jgi:hypothetical protein
MHALGNPPIVKKVPAAEPNNPQIKFFTHELSDQVHPGLVATTKAIQMQLYSDRYFQQEEAKQVLEANPMLYNWCQPDQYALDGNHMWVAWFDRRAFDTDHIFLPVDIMDNILWPMIWPMIDPVVSGYLGYFKVKPVVTVDGTRIRVDCANNLHFWAEAECEHLSE